MAGERAADAYVVSVLNGGPPLPDPYALGIALTCRYGRERGGRHAN